MGMPTPSIRIENLPIGSLIPAPLNPNRMPDAIFQSLVAAITEAGFVQPVLVRELESKGQYQIIDGHHRVRAAEVLTMQEVPCVVVHTDAQQEMILRIGMNQLRGELDLTSVGSILKDLVDGGAELEVLTLTGLSEGEISDLLKAVGQNVDIVVPTTMDMPAGDYDPDDGTEEGINPFELKIEFRTREDLVLSRKGLRRAAGKAKDLATGLLNLLGAEKKKVSQ